MKDLVFEDELTLTYYSDFIQYFFDRFFSYLKYSMSVALLNHKRNALLKTRRFAFFWDRIFKTTTAANGYCHSSSFTWQLDFFGCSFFSLFKFIDDVQRFFLISLQINLIGSTIVRPCCNMPILVELRIYRVMPWVNHHHRSPGSITATRYGAATIVSFMATMDPLCRYTS